MKQFYFSLLLVLFTFTLHAQHCGFDNYYLLGVRPFAGDSSNVVRGLTITLVDQYQRPLALRGKPICKQNAATTMSIGSRPMPYQDIQFYFAAKDYVFVGNQDAWQTQPAYIKIEDRFGRNNGQNFATQLIPFSQSNFIHLCSYDSKYKNKKFEKYQPIWVDLNHPKNVDHKEYTAAKPFIFVLDKKPEDVAACEAIGCYAVRLQVIAEWSQAVLFDELFQGSMNHDNCPMIYQIGDYNFDGYSDFRLCLNGDGLHYNRYFLYDQQRLKFYQDSLLSSFNSVDFNFDNKTAVGYSALRPYTGNAYKFEQEIYRISGERLAYVKVEKILSGSTGWHPQMDVVDSFLYVNQKRKDIPRTDKLENTQVIYSNGWRVERQVEKYYGPETTEIKPIGYQRKQMSLAIYRIYRVSDEKLLATLSGEQYLDFKPEYVKPPIMKDVDFDGSPDLWIPKSNGQEGYFYHGYNAQKQSFELLFISNLQELKVDSVKQIATGFRINYPQYGGAPSHKTQYELRGKGLQIHKETNIPLPQPKPAEQPPLPNPAIFSKTLGGYTYQLRTIEPTDDVQLPLQKGAYAQKVVVFAENTQAQIAKFYIHGNYSSESNFNRKELEISYLNYDAVPDILVPMPTNSGRKQVYLSCNSDENVTFYFDAHLSKCDKIESEAINKTVGGKYQEGQETFFVQYHFLTQPLLYLTRQNNFQPQTATRAIFKNNCGQLEGISAQLVAPIKSAPKREFEDYNFDGHEDFRVECDSSEITEYTCWNYYFFNPKTNGYDFQENLLGTKDVQIDKVNQQLMAYKSSRTFVDKKWQNVYEEFEYKNGILLPTKRTTCTQYSYASERSDCLVEIFENGQWKHVETIRGAE